MAVIAYQLIIIATVWLAYRSSPRTGYWVALAWSAETVILLFFPPLILIQLGVVWGTYFVLKSGAAKSQRIDQLEQQLRDHPAATRERLRVLDPADLEFISGRDHQVVLHQTIETSRERLCILSGWLSDAVINANFLSRLESALMRGVQVYLGYGFEDSEGGHSESRPANRALRSLRSLQQKSERLGFRGRLQIGKFPNHEKILVRDDDLVVCGSNNWLSNTRFRNSERSVVVRRGDFAGPEAERVSKLVAEHPVGAG